MQSAANFYKAARPEPPRCIGLQLHPYSVGHHIALHAYDSGFTSGNPRFEDLVLGVFICSQSWKEWDGWRNSWKLAIFLRVWSWFAGKFDIKAEAEKFAGYISENSAIPEVAIPANGRSMTAPWESRIVLFLIEKLGLTIESAMDFPLALAWQYYVAHGEKEGNLTLISEADETAFAFRNSDRCRELVEEAKAAARREAEELAKSRN